MTQEAAVALRARAQEEATYLSLPDRPNNPTRETFTVEAIHPLSEHTAAIVYMKNTGKRALSAAFLTGGKWISFVVTNGHLLGMQRMERYYWEAEDRNFPINFK